MVFLFFGKITKADYYHIFYKKGVLYLFHQVLVSKILVML
jgi:hypothetical protein